MQNQKGNIGVIVSFIIVIGLIGLVIYSLMNKPIKENPLEGIKNGEINEQAGQVQPSAEQAKSAQELLNNQKNMNQNTKVLSNFTPISKVASLEKVDVVVGTGAEVKTGATVSVHYTGAVAATGVVFQSSKDFGTEPVTFPLGNVIKGWTDGIPGMKIGGTRRLIIPAEMAYGANPPGGSGIPANADLVFDVELVAIK
jgi:FKBP-type peptidyl-prolyl cis-trans isomerase